MLRIGIVFIAAALAGCAAKVIDSNPASVMIRAGHAMPTEAAKLAQLECQKHGKSARLNQRDPNAPIWHFDCV